MVLEIVLGIATFTGIILTLTGVILLARTWLVPSGTVTITINDERRVTIAIGGKLMTGLAQGGIVLPSACGGKGACGQCRVQVLSGGGAMLPTERSLISKREAKTQQRLACQLSVRQNLSILLPPEIFGATVFKGRVRSNHNVTPLIKEIVLELSPHHILKFRAGSYIQIKCPPYDLCFVDILIEPEYRAEWDRLNLWQYESHLKKPTQRAYSLANAPAETGVVVLNVRIAIPPPGARRSVPPGAVSSYLFGLGPGDWVELSGPFGEFHALDTDREMVFIAGGAGMAPMRSHILDQLLRIKTQRRISFWYGTRTSQEVFNARLFDQLAHEHPNFDWHVVLSEPRKSDHWEGHIGLVHQVVHDQYLVNHSTPDDLEYYVCGPPLMNAAVIKMLEDLGVDEDHIMLDDFGG